MFLMNFIWWWWSDLGVLVMIDLFFVVGVWFGESLFWDYCSDWFWLVDVVG